jgi:nitrogen-specific signal transduction histidine kinase/CheY-like chemotaxis protein
VKSKTGHPINFVIVERDVTDVARHERQIRQAEKLEAIGTLATGIADDFNNIVMAMIGYAEMAERSVFDNAAVREELDHILLAGRRGTDLVKQILTFSRRDEQEKYPVDVHRVFKEALTLIRASTPSTIEIRQNIDVSTGPVMADPTQMHQVLMNLCANACEAMEGSDGVLEVTVRDDVLSEGSPDLGHSDLTPGRYVKLTVSDTGSGIPPELLDRIFDPYFTTREAGKKTGLGLSVVLGIVQSHGGAVTVNSRPGRGTTVDVYLPHCEATADSVHVEGHERESGTEWIIFVDDEEQLSEFGGRTLESLGYRVTALTDPLKAVEIARENPQEIDLVITDLMMPNMTGVELAGSLMQISPGLPILLCTGFEEALSRKKVREMGFVDLLMKPVATSVLEEVVPKVLSAKRARKAR